MLFKNMKVVFSHHFSLTEYDQVNLFKLETLAHSGEEILPYHEDDKPCRAMGR